MIDTLNATEINTALMNTQDLQWYVIGVLVAFLMLVLIWALNEKSNTNKYKRFLVKNKKIQEYEDWEHDRKIE